MRIMPFMKRKNGVQFAGVGLDTESGGGGGGGLLVNYSLEEQDTGQKWVDGKSIYCKTFNGFNANTQGTKYDAMTGVARVIKMEVHNTMTTWSDSTVYKTDYQADCRVYNSNGNVDIHYTNSGGSADLLITVFYTKR